MKLELEAFSPSLCYRVILVVLLHMLVYNQDVKTTSELLLPVDFHRISKFCWVNFMLRFLDADSLNNNDLATRDRKSVV